MDKPVSLVERLSKCCPCRGRVFSKCRAEAYCPCSDADKLGAVGKKNTVACLWSGHVLEAEAKALERHACYDDDGVFVGAHRWVPYVEYPNAYSTDASPRPRKVWCPACAVVKVQPRVPLLRCNP